MRHCAVQLGPKSAQRVVLFEVQLCPAVFHACDVPPDICANRGFSLAACAGAVLGMLWMNGPLEVVGVTSAYQGIPGLPKERCMGLLTGEREVSCIRKSDRQDPYTRIESVGGGKSLLTMWTMSLDDAIKGIEAGTLKLYTHVGGHKRNIVVVSRLLGSKYLRTEADRDTPDNLLSLPECPG